ncbi:hypothetical protein YTPLAS73_09110 [Nitrosarchaeum sp.]|nr:hypothetical protein YTPLAS73_09110 [Nitrosarchaeum sp.]
MIGKEDFEKLSQEQIQRRIDYVEKEISNYTDQLSEYNNYKLFLQQKLKQSILLPKKKISDLTYDELNDETTILTRKFMKFKLLEVAARDELISRTMELAIRKKQRR